MSNWAQTSDVRELLFERREHQTNLSGTEIVLGRRDAVAIASLEKNGSALTEVDNSPSSGEFSFTEPDTITLGDSATSSDEFVIIANIYLTDSEITDVINDVHERLLAKIETVYDTSSFSGTPPLLAEIERAASAYALLKRMEGHPNFAVSEQERASYLQDWQDAKESLQGLLDGDIKLLDSSGSVIDRKSITTDEEAFFSFSRSGHANDQDGGVDNAGTVWP